MVFIECMYCKEPTWATDFKFLTSDKMVLRVYKKKCPYCKKELEFFWHENSDQIYDEGKLD